MTHKFSELIEQYRRLDELAKNAARKNFETNRVENDNWSTPDDIIRAKDDERRAYRAYVKQSKELRRNIDAAVRENGIAPSKRIRSRILDALLAYILGHSSRALPAAGALPGGS